MTQPPHKTLPLALAALGVVFGDIGTSPLYAFKECIAHGSSAPEILGIVSLILWSLIVLVSVKYIGIILRADNQGEGGILALLTLAFPEKSAPGTNCKAALMTGLGIFGAALLYGDGAITPAISVLSAVEGLSLISPEFKRLAVPLTVGILLGLFWLQKKGSGAVGKVFGPIMLLWFGCLALAGAVHLREHPQILAAFNPWFGFRYLFRHGETSLVVLGSVFLSVTGGEALYADLGHFGRGPIRLAWNALVLPALALNYLGQGANVIAHPEAGANPFFLLVPPWALVPMVVLATAATVIASQALISGVFSLTMQAMQMGYLPRMNILHTSETASGQIYVPQVNSILALACIALVLGFQTSSALASAYGVAVTLTMLSTSALFYFAARRLWQWSRLKAGLVCALFASIESAFFASNALKIAHGGWLPLCIGAFLFYLMTTWKMGRALLLEKSQSPIALDDFVSETSELRRVPGTAVFLTASPHNTPGALVRNAKHNQVMHERVIVLTVVTDHVPRRHEKDRFEIHALECNFFRVIAHFGFMEIPTMQAMIEMAKQSDYSFDEEAATFFLSGQNLIPTPGQGLPPWREPAFLFMSRNAQKAAEFLRMPCERTLEIDWPVEI
jgi:KUP system potassium uptake protein